MITCGSPALLPPISKIRTHKDTLDCWHSLLCTHNALTEIATAKRQFRNLSHTGDAPVIAACAKRTGSEPRGAGPPQTGAQWTPPSFYAEDLSDGIGYLQNTRMIPPRKHMLPGYFMPLNRYFDSSSFCGFGIHHTLWRPCDSMAKKRQSRITGQKKTALPSSFPYPIINRRNVSIKCSAIRPSLQPCHLAGFRQNADHQATHPNRQAARASDGLSPSMTRSRCKTG